MVATHDHFVLPRVTDRVAMRYRIGHLYSRGVYDAAKDKLPGRKAPGLDGVPNEVLQHLPAEFHDAMHALFVTLWRLQVTPKEWKTSLTILLYNKDDPHEVKNHRPIGLLNTVYKLWTAVVTRCLALFVERNHLLSDAQEGFRPERNTTRQLQRLIMAFEDARVSDSPIYALYVDFVNAFGSVDHRRMAQIMEMQAYPPDIIAIIRDL